MYELKQVGRQSYYINSPAKIGIYRQTESDVYLIDSGNDKEAAKKVLKIAGQNGWNIKGIVNTHSNADHIGGNQYVQKQTGCPIFASGVEGSFTRYPILEPSFLYGGYPFKELRSKFLLAKESEVADCSSPDFPSELELIPLPGHFFDMVGVRTPDDTVFLADCVSSPSVLEKYGVTFIYDGTAYVIDATCSSGAPVLVTYELNGEISHVNSFSEVGKYVITLTAEETDSYYAPAVAAMEITILRDVLLAEDDGIDIRVDNEDGFDPDVSVEMEKLPQNDPGINAVISSSESVVRAYNVQVVDGNGEITTIVNNPSISVKVPSSLKENATVKVIVKEKGNYSVKILDVKEGYVTIDNAADVTTIAFISEAENDYLIYILIGGAALIILVSTIVFMFRKRA